MQFLFVRSGFPLELPFPRFVTSPQLFFRSGIPHHRGSLRTFTAVRISRRSYHKKAALQRNAAFVQHEQTGKPNSGAKHQHSQQNRHHAAPQRMTTAHRLKRLRQKLIQMSITLKTPRAGARCHVQITTQGEQQTRLFDFRYHRDL